MYKILLAMSLALNVTLLGVLLLAPERPSAPESLPAREPMSAARQPHITSAPEQIQSARATGPAWQQALPQLRDAGVPNDVLAGLVLSDFEIQWQKQWLEFEQRYQAGAVDDDERARFEARRDVEQENALRAALGDEGFRQWDKSYSLRDLDLVQLQLSPAETDALYQLRKERARKDRLLAEALRNVEIDEADYNEQQAIAQQEYDQQFQLLLGDERFKALQDLEEGGRESLRVPGADDVDQLQKNQDGRYQLLKRYARLWSLSESDIDYIYSSVRHYPAKTPHDRDQIEQSLMAYLGPQRFDRLKKNDLFSLGEQSPLH